MKQQNITTVKVRPGGGRDYLISIGSGISGKLAPHVSGISGNCRALVVTDRIVGKFYLDSVSSGLRGKGIDVQQEVIPAGERFKNANTYRKLIARLADLDDARDLVVVALGGGVVGDLSGFAAATYRRGISFIQVPTTLLAAVDSSVGGKTGVDLPQGKNLLGAFHQPAAVIVDLDLMKTLPKRELRAGMAEVIKYGFIMDEKFSARLDRNMGKLMALDPEETAYAVRRCCELKAKVVAADERDTKGVRAILNFGHTFAHAIEAACGYGKYRHGEAVGVGMVCAADLSARLGLLSNDDAAFVENTVRAVGLPMEIRGSSPAELMDYMRKDKKSKAGKLRFIVLDKIGHAFLKGDIDRKDIAAVLKKRVK